MAYSSPSNQIRIREGTVRELQIPKDKLEELEKIVSSPKIADEVKKQMIKKLAKASPCCICGGVPSLEVLYDAGGASRIERYCRKVYRTGLFQGTSYLITAVYFILF